MKIVDLAKGIGIEKGNKVLFVNARTVGREGWEPIDVDIADAYKVALRTHDVRIIHEGGGIYYLSAIKSDRLVFFKLDENLATHVISWRRSNNFIYA